MVRYGRCTFKNILCSFSICMTSKKKKKTLNTYIRIRKMLYIVCHTAGHGCHCSTCHVNFPAAHWPWTDCRTGDSYKLRDCAALSSSTSSDLMNLRCIAERLKLIMTVQRLRKLYQRQGAYSNETYRRRKRSESGWTSGQRADTWEERVFIHFHSVINNNILYVDIWIWMHACLSEYCDFTEGQT